MICSAVVAFGTSNILHLPEPWWAVITVLIVTRPDVQDAVQAGVHRLSGTLLGCAVGMLGAIARHHGAPELLVLVALLMVVATAAVWRQEFRAAPMAAMIVASASPHGASPMAAGLLRLAEIVIGIAAGLLVTRLLRYLPDTSYMQRKPAWMLDALGRQLSAGLTGTPALPRGQLEDLRRLLRLTGAELENNSRMNALPRQRGRLLIGMHTDIQFLLRLQGKQQDEASTQSAPLVEAVCSCFAATAHALENGIDEMPPAFQALDERFPAAVAEARALTDGGQRERMIACIHALRRLRYQLRDILRPKAVDE